MKFFKAVLAAIAGIILIGAIPKPASIPATTVRMRVVWNQSKVSSTDSIDYYWARLWINGVEQSHLYGVQGSGLGWIPPTNTFRDDFNTGISGTTHPLNYLHWSGMVGQILAGPYSIFAPNPIGGVPPLNIARVWNTVSSGNGQGNHLQMDQWAEITALTMPPPASLWGVGVRLDTAGALSGYFCRQRADSVYIVVMTNATDVVLRKAAYTGAVNDRLRCEVQGDTIRLKVNSVQIISAISSQFNTRKTSQVGVYIMPTATVGTVVLDDFAAGDMGNTQWTSFDVPPPRPGELAEYLFKVTAFTKLRRHSKPVSVIWRRTNGPLVPTTDDTLWSEVWLKVPKSGIVKAYADSLRLYRTEYIGTDTIAGAMRAVLTLPPRDTVVRLPYMIRGNTYGYYYTTFWAGFEFGPAKKLFRAKAYHTWP